MIPAVRRYILKYAEIIGFAIVSLAVLLPMLAPGYILTIDMVFAPHPPMPTDIANDFLFRSGLHAVSYLVPGDVLQKIMLLSTLLLAGIGAQRLCRLLLTEQDGAARFAAFAAGLFYMINPFVYGRLMAGQYVVLLGYALLPFFVRAVFNLASKPSGRKVATATIWALLLSIISIHVFGLAVAAAFVILIMYTWQKRRDATFMKKLLVYLAASAAAFILLSSYWLIPVLLGTSSLQTATGQFTAADFAAFATDGGLLAVLQLKGFWLEAQGLFTGAGEPLPFSGIWQLLLWGVVAAGFIFVWKRQKSSAIVFGILTLLALCFAIDGPLSQWFVTHIPGYREPHKLVALIALSFSVFFGFGARLIIAKFTKQRGAITIGLVLLPLLVTPAMLWGCSGQLRPTDYPKEWYSLNKNMDTKAKVLFLPWHMYMKFSFTQRIIANPADMFFDARVITSQDPEFAGSRAPVISDTVRKIDEEILPTASKKPLFGSQLRSLGITHVLLAKEGDWRENDFLKRQRDLLLIDETPAYRLYKTGEKVDE